MRGACVRACVHASPPLPSPPTHPPPSPSTPKNCGPGVGSRLCMLDTGKTIDGASFIFSRARVRACVRMQVDEQVLLVLRVVEYGARGVARVPVRQRTLRTSAGATELASCDGHVVPFLSSMRLRVESTRGEPVYILSHACVFGRLVSAAFPSSVSYGRCCHPAMMLQA